jgi:hypothetical protein
MVCFIVKMNKWYVATNANDIKEWDALESNKTIAGGTLQQMFIGCSHKLAARGSDGHGRPRCPASSPG